MNILIATFYLDYVTGSALYVFDVAMFLKKKGHHVYVYSPFCGVVSKKLQEENIITTENLNDFSHNVFDVIHCHHEPVAYIVRKYFPKTPILFVSHGVLPDLEKPPQKEVGISSFVAVSEEVRDNLARHGVKKKDITIVRNFVDINRFFSQRPIRGKPKNVLVISNYWKQKNRRKIIQACKELGLNITVFGQKTKVEWCLEDRINDADLVISLGRGALEGLACERVVLVYDYHYGDGIVTPDNIHNIKQSNFSGRCFKIDYDTNSIKKAIQEYDPFTVKNNRKIVVDEFNIDTNMMVITSLYEKIRGTPITANPKKYIQRALYYEKKYKKSFRKLLYVYFKKARKELPIIKSF